MLLTTDQQTALHDAMITAFGTAPTYPHPSAELFADAPLSKAAEICGQATNPVRGSTPRTIQARGMTTGDFGHIIATAAATFAVNRYTAAARHLAFCGQIEAANFNPVEIANIGNVGPLAKVGEFGEIQRGSVTMSAVSNAQLTSYASSLMFSREVVVNDQTELVAKSLTGFGNAAALTEAQAVYGALHENPTMNDGAPVFHSDYGNIVGALADTTLAAALAALRNGFDEPVDLPAAHLVVAAGLEYTATKLVRDAGLPLAVTASALLPAGEWYLLPDPQIQPVVSVIRLKSVKTPVRIEPHPTPIEIDGFTVKASCELGAVILSRHVIRGAA
jgi:hypothetical protein